MSGHSHWATIKHKKGAADAKKGKLFSKLAKEIMIAARAGGGDLDMNLKLKYAVDKARAANMKKDSIDLAIKKATGELGSVSYEELAYEGYGPGGVAFFIEVITDNRNRTQPELRKMFEGKGGRLAEKGTVAWQFERKGLISFPGDAIEEDALMELALEAGADDVQSGDGAYLVETSQAAFEKVKDAITKKGIQLTLAEVQYVPKNTVPVDPKDEARVQALIEALEDQDDVQSVATNLERSAAAPAADG